MLLVAGALLLAYLLGSLSGSLLLGRIVGVDIRSQGSGNAGGTNAFRVLGWRFALGVIVVDIGKGALAAWVGLILAPAVAWPAQSLAYACVLMAVVGHTWPVFFAFRGGKGAGTLVGGLLLVWPLAIPPLLLIWVLVLTSSGYVGLATVCAALGLIPAALWLPAESIERSVFALIAAAFIVFTHRLNLVRLAAGNEHRFERVRVWARLFGK